MVVMYLVARVAGCGVPEGVVVGVASVPRGEGRWYDASPRASALALLHLLVSGGGCMWRRPFVEEVAALRRTPKWGTPGCACRYRVKVGDSPRGSAPARAGLTEYESLRREVGECLHWSPPIVTAPLLFVSLLSSSHVVWRG